MKILKLILVALLLTACTNYQLTVAERPITRAYLEVKEPTPLDENSVECLTKNIYFEARNQPIEGQFAVAEVVLNRVNDPQFPDDICKVVEQASSNGCQFSWFCDGKKDVMTEKRAKALATYIAVAVIERPTNVTKGAKYYHANYVSPNWGKEKTVIIGDHVFYT